jgi:hypothetical protein
MSVPQASKLDTVPEANEYGKDVFISYSHDDKEWVRDVLLPRLEQAELKVIVDYRDFDVGVPSLTNMEEAVDQARHTLVVLTPAWVESEWTEFEGLLIGTDDPTGRRRRLVPLLLKKCPRLPRRIAFFTYADFTDPPRCDEEMGRLLRTLTGKVVPPSIRPILNEQIAQSARDGLGILAEVIKISAVRDAATGFKAAFQVARQQIEVLGKYKRLHDLLHELQFHCYELIIHEARQFPDEEAVSNLGDHALTLLDIVEKLKEIADRPPNIRDEGLWIQDLVRAQAELQGAIEACDAARLVTASRLINKVLSVQPSRIHTRLDCAAKSLQLPTLSRAMMVVCEKARDLGLDQERMLQFQASADALDGLNKGLDALINDHDHWQAVDVELRRIEGCLDRDLLELKASWHDLKGMVEQFCLGSTDSWSVKLTAISEQLDRSIAARDPIKIRDNFRRFRRRAGEHFYRVDLTLKDFCEALRKVGEPLALVLGMIS